MKTKLRKEMVPVACAVRAFFAPVDRASSTPTVFDPAKPFDLAAPPPPWMDAGAVTNFRRAAATRVEAVKGGPRGGAIVQFRSALDARVEFDLREWGKLQMTLAAGSQHMNVLAEQEGAAARGSGGAAEAAVPLAADSTASQLVFAEVCPFSEADIVAVDVDYAGEIGYVGSGVAGGYVMDPGDVQSDPDYIRRITLNIGRVVAIAGTTVDLERPLIGGAPLPGAAAQKVVGFVDREGGSFFQEWSALFVVPDEVAGRICFYYPRLQAAAPAQESAIEIAGALGAQTLHASFMALPVQDLNDCEQVVCYRSYFPARASGLI